MTNESRNDSIELLSSIDESPISSRQNSSVSMSQNSSTAIDTTSLEMASTRNIKDDLITKRRRWLLGLSFSIFPILIKPFIALVLPSQYGIKDALFMLLTNVSILYVGVTAVVTALNDLEPNDNGRSYYYIIILFLVAIVYTIIEVVDFLFPGQSSSYVKIIINIIVLVASIVPGAQQYNKSPKKKRGKAGG